MSRSTSPRSTLSRHDARSVRHSQRGCRERRGTGTSSKSPLDDVPTPVSAVDPLLPRQGLSPLARAAAAIALTTLDGHAVLRVATSSKSLPPSSELLRLQCGTRVLRPVAADLLP